MVLLPVFISSSSGEDAIINGVDRIAKGTYFAAGKNHLKTRQQWMAFYTQGKGRLYIDSGAARALTEGGKSLLPSGIVAIEGEFIEEITEEAAASRGKFEVKRTSDRRYMFNVRAGNTQVIASSQIYSSMSACRNGIESVGKNAPIAPIEDQTLSSVNEEKCPKFQIYFDKAGKYRFNLLAANGQNILACTQGYTQKSSCKNGIQSVINNASAAIVLPSNED